MFCPFPYFVESAIDLTPDSVHRTDAGGKNAVNHGEVGGSGRSDKIIRENHESTVIYVMVRGP